MIQIGAYKSNTRVINKKKVPQMEKLSENTNWNNGT